MRFNGDITASINHIMRNAWEDGRKSLYEHEVYEVLRLVGLAVPRFVFVHDPSDVDERMLQGFGRDLVLKIVSPQIAHKQKLGGVRIIRNHDLLFLQFAMTRMCEEVLSHFTPENKPEIKGFTLIEFIPHTEALGYEVLIGCKDDPAFGPVITLSKGGDDAEFFAAHYDPANLFLSPLEPDRALAMMQTLKIKHKFEQIGHLEYLELMAEAAATLSRLSYHYSRITPERPAFVIKSLEVNPFVVAKDGRFIALDGYAEFEPVSEPAHAVRSVKPEGLEYLFAPKGVAVIGVSSDPAKYSLGREIAHLLHDLNRDDLYLVNSKGGSVMLGNRAYRLYQRLGEIEDRVDLAVYAAPGQYTADFVRDLAGTGVKAAILISGVPAQMKYTEFAAALDTIRPPGIRILGPNCMGIFHAPQGTNPGLNTLFVEEKRLEIKSAPHSNVALLTQSGALAVTAIDKLQNARVFKAVVSFGNKYDIKVADLIAYFGRDPSVDVLALYLEGLDPGEGRQFSDLARGMEKPIIVYKGGRTEAGARAAALHTAAMSGSYDVFKAACEQSGVIMAGSIEEHYDLVKAFSLLARRIPRGNRVSGVVNAGFESTVGADELNHLRQATLAPETVARLGEINTFGLVDTSAPFLDITPMADDRMYADFAEAVLEDPNVDCVFVAVVPHASALKTDPETCHDPNGLANLLVSLSKRHHKPMVVSVNAGRHYQEFISIMECNGIPVYTDIRSAIKSLDVFVTYHLRKDTSAQD